MTDTTITDAVAFPQDDGTGVPGGSEDFTSAGFFALLARYVGDGTYIGQDETGSPTLAFTAIDTTNETVNIGAGHAYVLDSGVTVQSGAQNTYDTTLPDSNVPYVVVLPTATTALGLATDAVNDVWLAVDPTANDSVYLRHGTGLSAPTDPSVKIGTVDTASGATTRPNDGPATTRGSVNVTGPLSVHGAEVQCALDGQLVPVGDGLGVNDAIDPASTTTPFADAIALISDGDTIILPPATFTEAGPTSITKELNLRTFGKRTTIQFTNSTGAGLLFDTASSAGDWDAFRIDGGGGRTSGNAIECTAGYGRGQFGGFWLEGWDSTDPLVNFNGGHLWSSNIGFLDGRFGGSNQGSLLVYNSHQVTPVHIRKIYHETDDTNPIITNNFNNCELRIDQVNVGGNASMLLDGRGSSKAMIHLGSVNFEPTQDTAGLGSMFDLRGGASFQVDYIFPSSASITGTLTLNQVAFLGATPANKHIGTIRTADVTTNNAPINVFSDTGPGNFYKGPSSDLVNNSGTSPLSNAIECLPGEFTG